MIIHKALPSSVKSFSQGYLSSAIQTSLLMILEKPFIKKATIRILELRVAINLYNQIQQGAALLATVKINFSSRDEKEKFSAQIAADISGLGSVRTAIQKAVKKHNLRGNVKVLVYQLGGDATRLAKALSKDPHSNYYITKCHLNDLSACQSTIDGILDYASQEFPQQLEVANGEVIKNDPKATVASFDKALSQPVHYLPGLNAGKSLVTDEVKQARASLVVAVNKARYLRDSFSAILDYYGSMLPDNVRHEISNGNKNAIYNLSLLNNNSLKCYTEPTECVELAKTLQSELKPYPETIYDYFEGSLYDTSTRQPLTMTFNMPFLDSTIVGFSSHVHNGTDLGAISLQYSLHWFCKWKTYSKK